MSYREFVNRAAALLASNHPVAPETLAAWFLRHYLGGQAFLTPGSNVRHAPTVWRYFSSWFRRNLRNGVMAPLVS